MRPLRTLLVAVLLLLAIAGGGWWWLLHTESGARWLWAQGQAASDSRLQAQQLSGDLSSGLQLRGISFVAESFRLQAAEMRLIANMDLLPLRLRVESLTLRELDVWPAAPTDTAAAQDSQPASPTVTLPLPVHLAEAAVIDFSFHRPDQQALMLQRIELAGSWYKTLVIDRLLLQHHDSQAQVHGQIGLAAPYPLSLAAQLSKVPLPGTAAVAAATRLQVSGRLDEFSLTLASDDWLELTARGAVSHHDAWAVSADVDLKRLSPAAWLEQWPAGETLYGEWSFWQDGHELLIQNGRLAQANGTAEVSLDGRIDTASGLLDGDLHWRDLSWPIGRSEPGLRSERGAVTLRGTTNAWQLDGTLAIATTTLPSGQFHLTGSGDQDQVEVSILDSQVLGGSVQGQASYRWRDAQPWTADLRVDGIQLDALDPRWPTDVSGAVTASGTEAPFQRDIELQNLRGTLQNFRLSADGGVTLDPDNVTARELTLHHGDSRLAVDGSLQTAGGLHFDLAIAELGRYDSAASGAFAANGSVSVDAAKPHLALTGQGSNIRVAGWQASSLAILDTADDRCPIGARLVVPELEFDGRRFTDTTLDLCGDLEQQAIAVNVSHADLQLTGAALGQFKNASQSWDGQLTKLDIDFEAEPFVTLSAPAAVAVAADTVQIARTCLAGANAAELCVALDWSADAALQVMAELRTVPLKLLNRMVATDLLLDQTLDATIDWSQDGSNGINSTAAIELSAGTIASLRNTAISIPTEPAELAFEIVGGRLSTGNATLLMPGFGRVDLALAIPDIALAGDSRVDGAVDIAIADMGLLAAISPLIESAAGELAADIEVRGTLAEPLLVGDFNVVDGQLNLVPLGLQLDDINLDSTLYDDGQVELTGHFLSGSGRGEIYTRADYTQTAAKGFELQLRGNNLTLIDVPDIKARADLDLQLGYDFRQLTLAGDILIPRARVRAAKLAVTQDTESDDVVIVAGDLPDEALQPDNENPLQLAGSVSVELGDDVAIDLGLATAELTGKTEFTWQNSLLPIADGRYDLTGSVQAFGQSLQITDGGLRFPKIPVDNPFVRIRAEREIYGNAQVKTAGILVDGSLRQLSVEPYTRPLTTEERALTLLVTGSDFDFEQGVGAVDFGTYIAPRVFVSYGVGLFETENVIRVRYDLARGFGITGTSGEKESGIDLSYRLER